MIKTNRQGGFTLVEVAIILTTLAILSAILIPNIGSFNRLARFIKVKEDLQVLCTAMKVYLDDTGESAFYAHGNGGQDTPDRTALRTQVGMLIGDGDTPDDPTVSQVPAAKGGSGSWASRVDQVFQMSTDKENDKIEFIGDTFANHLIQNTPLNRRGRHYRTPQEMQSGGHSAAHENGLIFDPQGGEAFNSLFAWRGPYINDRVYPDPWGNRYAANVFALYTPQGSALSSTDGFASAVVCYSAGPDEEIDTAFDQPSGWFTGDDDQTVILHAGGW